MCFVSIVGEKPDVADTLRREVFFLITFMAQVMTINLIGLMQTPLHIYRHSYVHYTHYIER